MFRWFVTPLINWFALLRASWHTALVSLLSQTLATAAVAVAGRGLGKNDYGDMATIFAFYGWFSLLAAYPTCALIPSRFADERLGWDEKARAAGTAFMLVVAQNIVTIAIVLAVLPWSMRHLGLESFRSVATTYAIVFALATLRPPLDFISQSAGWLWRWSISNFISTTLPLALLAGYQFTWQRLTPQSYVALLLIANALGASVSFGLFLHAVGGWRALRPDLSVVWPFLRSGIWPWLANLSNVIVASGVPILIRKYLSGVEVGYFSLVTSFVGWVSGAAQCVAVPAMADWARMAAAQEWKALRRDFRRRQWATTALLALATVIILAGARIIMVACYGNEYRDASGALRVQALVLLTVGPGCWYWPLMFAIGRPRYVAVPNIIAGVVQMAVTVFLLEFTPLGLAGPLLAGTASGIGWIIAYEVRFRMAMRAKGRLA